MARAQDRVHVVSGNITGLDLNNQEYPTASVTAIKTALDDATNNITTAVSVSLGDEGGADPDYVKVKFFRNGKALALYKSKAWVQADAVDFRDEVITDFGGTPPA